MARRDDNSTVRIRLDISVPIAQGGANVQRMALQHGQVERLSVSHPPDGGSTQAVQVGPKWYICTYGTCSLDDEEEDIHVFARVFPDSLTDPPDDPPPGPETVGTIPDSQGRWRIELLPITGSPDTLFRKLVVWECIAGTCTHSDPVRFVPTASTSTYCTTYGLTQPSMLVQKKDWSQMADRWFFAMTGCSNKSCGNCSCLNGKWGLTRDKSCGQVWRWSCPLGQSFADPKQSSYWRLQFNEGDGTWYLDCVANLEQKPGTWISYRLHETAWNPQGQNVMHLATDSGYCNVPATVTIVPA